MGIRAILLRARTRACAWAAVWAVLLSMVQTAPANVRLDLADLPPENRVGGFSETVGNCAGPLVAFVQYPRLENEPILAMTASGRLFWLSRDPLGEQADPLHNLYRFVGNNPVNYVDPLGLVDFETQASNMRREIEYIQTFNPQWAEQLRRQYPGGYPGGGSGRSTCPPSGRGVTIPATVSPSLNPSSGKNISVPPSLSPAVQRTLNPAEINFSQRTVSANVRQYADDMAAGKWDWSRSGPLRIMQRDGQWVSYDNRRLLAAQQAGHREVPVQIVRPDNLMPGSSMTWEQAFTRRFNDPRNVQFGGAVPNTGLPTQPTIEPPRQ